MRKNSVNYFVDKFFWTLLYLLPIVAYLILLSKGTEVVTISSAMSIFGLDIINTNVVYESLNSLFGVSGIFPIFASADMLCYLTYFVTLVIIHLAIDFLLFIPRFGHYLYDKYLGGGY